MFGGGLFGGGMFPDMNQMMANMQGQMGSAGANPNGSFYSSSTVMSYSSDPSGGQPLVYRRSESTRQHGDVRETRRQVQDSHRGVDEMAIGHHIGERGHVIEKSKNRHTGDVEENTELINLDDDEARAFDQEWQSRTRHGVGGRREIRDRHSHHPRQRPAQQHLAITPDESHRPPQPAESSQGAQRHRRDHGKEHKRRRYYDEEARDV